jgi:lysophospholipase L1-like esterase
MVMPIIGQYEQACNAVALEQMGVRVFRKIKPDFDGLLRDWLHNVQPIRVSYPDETAEIIAKIMENKR